MQTYKQFLIYDNLRCYLDYGGKLTPMFTKTDFATIEQVYERVDRYWQEWEEWQAKRKTNIQKSFEIIKADTDLHDEAQEMDADVFHDKVVAYHEQKQIEGR